MLLSRFCLNKEGRKDQKFRFSEIALKNVYILDFWAQLFEWHTMKTLSVIGGTLSTIGFIPLMLNMIEYNQNQHIR